ncbi:LysR family transcriptional regulator [Methylobacterium sp. JK268]
MQTSSLRYFLAVARTGSIAAASAQLNVAGSAISRQIANLEAELDCVLFERRPRGMVPSPAGELLAQHAHHVLLRADQVTAEIRELEGLARGLIRIASAEGFALDLLPTAIAMFHARYSGIRFDLAVLPPAEVARVVAAGEADLGVAFARGPAGAVSVVYETVVETIGICAPDHPLVGAAEVRLIDLAPFPLVLPTRNTTARQVFEAACAAEGVTLEPVLTVNSFAAMLPFVRRTRGIGVMSALSMSTPIRLGTLAALPIRTAAGLTRVIQIQTMRDRRLPRAVRAFLSELIAAMPRAE